MMLHTLLLVAWFTLPVLVWAAFLCLRRRFHPVVLCAFCFVAMIAGTIVLANYVWALDAHLLAEVDKYDPGSPEARRASEEWASDTDRSLTLLLSPLLTGIWYTGVFLLLFGSRWIVGQMFPAKFASAHVKTDSETAEQQGDDGNPYPPPIVR